MSKSGVRIDTDTQEGRVNASDVAKKEIVLTDPESVYLLRFMESSAVLSCAQRYVNLCENFDEQVKVRATSKVSCYPLPADLQKIEEGINILCVGYEQLPENSGIRQDVRNSILSLSSIYERKTADAYFSACCVILNAHEIADKPDILKQLVDCRDNLQKLHSEWPFKSRTVNLSSFKQLVEVFGQQLGTGDQLMPEVLASSAIPFPAELAVHARVA